MTADPELQLGNFSYMVNMHAEAAQAQTVPQLQACLGSIARHVLELQNPVGTEVVLQTSCSNAHNFTLSSAAVVLSPYGQAQVYVDYLPSSLGTHTGQQMVAYCFRWLGLALVDAAKDALTELFVALCICGACIRDAIKLYGGCTAGHATHVSCVPWQMLTRGKPDVHTLCMVPISSMTGCKLTLAHF